MKVGVFSILKRSTRYAFVSISTFITLSFPAFSRARSLTRGSTILLKTDDAAVNSTSRVSGQVASTRSKVSCLAQTGSCGISRTDLQVPQIGLLASFPRETRFSCRHVSHRIIAKSSDMFDPNVVLIKPVYCGRRLLPHREQYP